MKKYKENFSEDELKQALKGKNKEAITLLTDRDKWNDFKEKFDEFIRKAYKIPILGSVIDDIVSMMQLADAYIKKEYTQVPWTTMVSIVATLVYLLSPIDLIPDFIPFIGYIDDVAVVVFVLKLGVGHDIEVFKEWQEINHAEAVREFGKMMLDSIIEITDGAPLAAMILCDNNELRVLTEADEQDELPIECYVHLLNMPVDQLKDLFIENEEEYLTFLNNMLDDEDIEWSLAGPLSAIYESDFEQYEDYFSIIDGEDYYE